MLSARKDGESVQFMVKLLDPSSACSWYLVCVSGIYVSVLWCCSNFCLPKDGTMKEKAPYTVYYMLYTISYHVISYHNIIKMNITIHNII